jgi:hypothetical protein
MILDEEIAKQKRKHGNQVELFREKKSEIESRIRSLEQMIEMISKMKEESRENRQEKKLEKYSFMIISIPPIVKKKDSIRNLLVLTPIHTLSRRSTSNIKKSLW